jgi:uncharacterized membrane protein
MVKAAIRTLCAFAMMAVGFLHFVRPAPFVAIVPKALPAPELLVAISGVAEIAGGLGLLWSRTRVAAAWGLIALYLAVFPANINQAINRISFEPGAPPPSDAVLWGRLPLQLVFIGLAYWFTRKDRR